MSSVKANGYRIQMSQSPHINMLQLLNLRSQHENSITSHHVRIYLVLRKHLTYFPNSRDSSPVSYFMLNTLFYSTLH